MDSTAITNAALRLLNAEGTVVDLDTDTSANSRLYKDQYELARDFLLRQHDWTFCTKTEELTAHADAPPGDWLYRWAHPTGDDIRIIRVYIPTYDGTSNRIQHDILISPVSGDKTIVTLYDDAQVEYTFKETDTNEWPAELVLALIAKVAEQLAMTINASREKKIEFQQDAMRYLSQAKKLDSGQRNRIMKRRQTTPLKQARGNSVTIEDIEA